MELFTSVKELRARLDTLDAAGVGFVPTMGALHAGHRSLVERARRENATVVVSVFVNPTQFNDKNDLKHYPRTPEADAALLEAAGADYVLMPSVEEIYPEPDGRQFDFGQIDKVMEGATRPGHFNGVAQVVSRLFDIVRPARAYFGEKDFQHPPHILLMSCHGHCFPSLLPPHPDRQCCHDQQNHKEKISKHITVHQIQKKPDPLKGIRKIEKVFCGLRAPLTAKHLPRKGGISQIGQTKGNSLRQTVTQAVPNLSVLPQQPQAKRARQKKEKNKIIILCQKT